MTFIAGPNEGRVTEGSRTRHRAHRLGNANFRPGPYIVACRDDERSTAPVTPRWRCLAAMIRSSDVPLGGNGGRLTSDAGILVRRILDNTSRRRIWWAPLTCSSWPCRFAWTSRRRARPAGAGIRKSWPFYDARAYSAVIFHNIITIRIGCAGSTSSLVPKSKVSWLWRRSRCCRADETVSASVVTVRCRQSNIDYPRGCAAAFLQSGAPACS